MADLRLEQWLLDPCRATWIMGVLNVTPDSFSDGGRFSETGAAVAHGLAMAEAGAQVIDVGGESTRPGAARIAAGEQLRRVLPVIQSLTAQGVRVSIDTSLSEVAREALAAGAAIINDISGGTDDSAILRVAASSAAPIILMHMRGQPATMQNNPVYVDVVRDVGTSLRAQAARAADQGVAPHRILLDPGIGFGKSVEHNLALLAGLDQLKAAGHAILVGASRKSFIGRITGESQESGRIMGTAAAVAWSIKGGADLVRVHDVARMAPVVAMSHALRRAAGAGKH